jgi:methanogenic corrinoid protein MtbC1
VTIEEFEKAGHRDKVKILIGGAPTTQAWADEIGADGWGKDAIAAVNIAKEMVDQPRQAWAA